MAVVLGTAIRMLITSKQRSPWEQHRHPLLLALLRVAEGAGLEDHEFGRNRWGMLEAVVGNV